MIRRRTAALGGLALLSSAAGARAQAAWPEKPVRMIVPYGPGGSADQVLRIYGEKLTQAFGQQVVIENKPGASGGVGAQMVAAAPADGYTYLLSPTAIMSITPTVRKVPYDPAALMPVARLSTPLLVVYVTNELGVKTWPEFVALAKANPGKFWFGSSGLGTITHLTGEVLTSVAGIKMQHAPYKTIVDAVGDVMAGRIHMVFDPSFLPQAKAGKVRAMLAATSARLPDIPDTPTARELGLDIQDFRDRSWFGLFGPKGMPPAIVAKLSAELGRIAAMPDVKDKLALVAQAVHHQPTEVFAKQVSDDTAYFAKLIKDLDLKLE
ncbi:MAG: tripartite tricarboxylate transporter substrate binding protein [Rhodospirillales bacterium]|nr:tripartite tricarboxylate transporter substrate binding protein [Rhodospirillales bacterium]